ncbi:MAG: CoA ester lyase [Pseudomonadota bacterium]
MSKTRPFRLERSTLIVPASNPRMIEKAAAAKADAVCVDLEDAVAPTMKAEARNHVVAALNALDFGGKQRQVRINGLDTPFAYRDLIEVVEGAGDKLDLIVLPKASRREDVAFVATMLDQVEEAMGHKEPTGIAALIETAAGIDNINEIAATSARLESLIFGSGDFAASMQMPLETIGGEDENDSLYPGHRWHFALQSIAIAARVNGLRAIDGPYAGIRDPEGLERFARVSRSLGFDGKWCIHPSQPEIVNAVFSPSEREVEFARRVIDTYAEAQAAGTGAITVDGKMVDAANLKMCRTVLAKAEGARRFS